MKMKKKKLKISPSPPQNTNSIPSDYHTAIATISVAQICHSVGYSITQTSALETLTAVAIKYLRSLASSAASSANSTGRTQCNLLDIIFAFERLHFNIGFHGNSDTKTRLHLLSNSFFLVDTMKFVHENPEIPFAQPLPRRGRIRRCFTGEKLNRIPRWMPEFPQICAEKTKKTVDSILIEDKIASEKMNSSKTGNEVSELPMKIVHRSREIPLPRRGTTFRHGFSGEKLNHIPPWLPEFPQICGEKTNKTVDSTLIEDASEKMNSSKTGNEISELPLKRKKVSFKLNNGGIRNEIGTEFVVDSMNGVCKGGKRISFQIYDDETGNHVDRSSMKKKLDESSSRTNLIMMH